MSEPVDETDWKAVAVQLAAIDHRAADIILAADRLAEAAERVKNIFVGPPYTNTVQALINALDAFKVTRQGQ